MGTDSIAIFETVPVLTERESCRRRYEQLLPTPLRAQEGAMIYDLDNNAVGQSEYPCIGRAGIPSARPSLTSLMHNPGKRAANNLASASFLSLPT